ncbi:MAG: plasmid stabilization protein ParE [Gammaproteobacteria bacterium]|nr:MAG: plasmid stabilization protein ParE [Gammaproteobacteria bacterium]
MGTFTLSKKANADLKSIAAYTQRKWGKEKRRVYLRQFDDSFHILAASPNLGVRCDFIKPGYRKFPVTSHLVFYKTISSAQIEIIRIVHKRMDAKSQLTTP